MTAPSVPGPALAWVCATDDTNTRARPAVEQFDPPRTCIPESRGEVSQFTGSRTGAHRRRGIAWPICSVPAHRNPHERPGRPYRVRLRDRERPQEVRRDATCRMNRPALGVDA